MVYHCHVQTGAHILMGLIGMFIIEENKPNNWVQTFNVGDGHVRHSSVAIKEKYDREYDLQYIGSDKELHNIIQKYNDPRLIAEAMNQYYRLSDRKPEYFTLNGKSFPFTLAESLIVVAPNEKIKLRMLNAGEDMLAVHSHGHKAKITHYDGIEHNPSAQITRDTYSLMGAQRVDLEIDTTNDGFHSYGEGVWLIHDHNEFGITTDSAMPGGNVSIIAYERYLNENGMPKVNGTDLTKFFTKEYYDRSYPVWGTLKNADKFGIVER
jgi:FtsP/CotA-like multicopper oxidase with cupredoxin domain